MMIVVKVGQHAQAIDLEEFTRKVKDAPHPEEYAGEILMGLFKEALQGEFEELKGAINELARHLDIPEEF